MLKIKSEKLNYGINFPTSVKEVTPEVLDALLDNIKLPKFYCVVALCFNTKLFDFVASIGSNNTNATVNVNMLLGKINEEDKENIKANVGDKLIIDRSSIERGTHLNVPTLCSSKNAAAYFAKDEYLRKSVINGTYGKDKTININKNLIKANSDNIIILEFKIIPINDIMTAIPVNSKIVDPFYFTDDKVN